RVAEATPNNRLLLVSFSVKSNSSAPAQYSRYSPSSQCLATSVSGGLVCWLGFTAAEIEGRRSSPPPLHVLGNQRAGSTQIGARYQARMMRMVQNKTASRSALS